LREERWLKVFEKRVLRKTFGSKRVEVRGEWRGLHDWGFVICTAQQILFG
jgi:hypothetical protein